MEMGRKKKQTDIEDTINEAPRKNSELTEDERRALHFRHCAEFESALAAKKKADAGVKNVGKRIKAEGDSVGKCKKTIQARSPQGEAELRAEIEQTAEVLRWSGVQVGETAEMFADRRPANESAIEHGKIAGMKGERAEPPHDPGTLAHKAWMEGWHAGQEILMASFQKMPAEDEQDAGGNGVDHATPPAASQTVAESLAP
jgi:hypothetical protein